MDLFGTDTDPAGTGANTEVSVVRPGMTRRAERNRVFLRLLTWAVTLVGVGAFFVLLNQLGVDAVYEGLSSLGQLWPLLLVLEAARVVCELAGTRALLGTTTAHMPTLRLIRGQLIAQALDVVMPAGRAAAEAAKAAVYAREVGVPQAAAIGTALQLAVLFANALWALAGFYVSGMLGLPSALRVGLLSYTAASCLLVLGVIVFAAAPPVRGWFSHLHLFRASLERFAQLLAVAPGRLVFALAAQLVGRCVQALQLAVAGTVLGAQFTLPQIALTQAVYLVGAALGDLVPAQLGTTDAAFVLAAPTLGLTAASAFSVAVAMHAVQLLMAGVYGLGALFIWWLESNGQSNHNQTHSASRPAAKLPQT